jgi:hypothetical protein
VLVDSNAARLISYATDDVDGFRFRTEPGVVLRVDVFLDGSPAPQHLTWVGDGARHPGALGNPLDLRPSAP